MPPDFKALKNTLLSAATSAGPMNESCRS
jgi:hypothetical protein